MTNQTVDFSKLTEAFTRGQDRLNQERNERHGEEPEDLNILPLPTRQDISLDKWIRWTWEIGEGDIAWVIVTLFLNDYENLYRPGDFETELVFCKPMDVFTLGDSEYAKSLGQAIVSASNWPKVWQQHVGALIKKSIGQ